MVGDVGEEYDVVPFLIIIVPNSGSHGVLGCDEADEEEGVGKTARNHREHCCNITW